MRKFSLALMLSSILISPAFAQQRSGTPEEQKACTRDVERFCRKIVDQGDFVVLACLQQNRDSGDFPVAGLVHSVNHHIVWLTLNVLFAGTVKVELRQLVPPASRNQKVSAVQSVLVVHPDGVAVVN